jgi:hypothetical protein
MRITAHEIPILDRVYMAVSLLKDGCGEPKSCTRVRATTLTYVKPQIANCISTLATLAKRGSIDRHWATRRRLAGTD